MRKNLNAFFAVVLLFVTSSYNCKKKGDEPGNPVITSKIYYVSAAGSDANTGLSATTPFATIAKAASFTSAGDVVLIMNGTYNSVSGPVLNVTNSGKEDKYITYKAYTGHSPKITASANVWNAVSINGSYIVFEGIELEGNNANLNYAGALAAYNAQLGGGAPKADYNTNAITIGGPAAESKKPHHVIIRNCKVHDFPGGGINSIQADYTTIEGNTVYNNAWYMVYAGSGISILTPFDTDAFTGYKNIVRNNMVYGNKTTIPWISASPQRLSDANGIIIDVNLYPYGASSGAAYSGRTLVQNNVSFNNGGSGIHAFKTNKVDIINNTAYGNGQVVGYGEIFAIYSNDVKVMNNIMYAKAGGKCNENSNNINVVYDYNIYFNGTVQVGGSNSKITDPFFVNASPNPAMANFSLQNTSPAIDGGTQTIFAPKDITGNTRPKRAQVDCGAYEVN